MILADPLDVVAGAAIGEPARAAEVHVREPTCILGMESGVSKIKHRDHRSIAQSHWDPDVAAPQFGLVTDLTKPERDERSALSHGIATTDLVPALSRSAEKPSLTRPLFARRTGIQPAAHLADRNFGLSLGLHGAILLGLMFAAAHVPPAGRSLTYQLIMLPAEPQPMPARQTSSGPPQPDKAAEQQQPAAAAVTPLEVPAEHPVAPSAEPSRPEAEPRPEPAAPARPHPPPPVLPGREAGQRAARSHGPMPSHRAPAHVARPPAAPAAQAPAPASRAPTGSAPPADLARLDPGWMDRVSRWLLDHRSYPEAARRHGRQGTVVVRFAVDRQGHVLTASLVQASGSALLDEAALALVRYADLPPFPSDMVSGQAVLTAPIRYQLE